MTRLDMRAPAFAREPRDFYRIGDGFVPAVPDGWLFFHPLLSGLAPETAWQSLQLLKAQVLPHLG